MIDLLAIALLWFILGKGLRALYDYEHREQRWRSADAHERERIVRHECAWRVIGRAVMCGGLAVSAFAWASPPLAVMWGLVALRWVMPIKDDLQHASSYRSTGATDEPLYSW